MSIKSSITNFNNSLIVDGEIPPLDEYLDKVNDAFLQIDKSFLEFFKGLTAREELCGQYCINPDYFVEFGIVDAPNTEDVQKALERLGFSRCELDWIIKYGELLTTVNAFYACLHRHRFNKNYTNYITMLQWVVNTYNKMVVTFLVDKPHNLISPDNKDVYDYKTMNKCKSTVIGGGDEEGGGGGGSLIYFIQDTNSYTRIGCTMDLKSELEILTRGTTGSLSVVDSFLVSDGKKVESLIHERLASKRMVREWFDVSMSDIHRIKDEFSGI